MMSPFLNDLNRLVLRQYPNATYDDRLTRSERLELIIRNLEQTQEEAKTEIIMQALLEQEELDGTRNDDTAPGLTSKDEASLSTIAQPKLRMMRTRWRPSMPKPADARTHSKSEAGQPLFVTQQSHAVLARETAAILDAYNKGTPASLQKFYGAKERIAREDANGLGSGGAGSPAAPVVSQGQGYDASRDPRLRR